MCAFVFRTTMSLFAFVGRNSSTRTAKLLRDVGRCHRGRLETPPSAPVVLSHNFCHAAATIASIPSRYSNELSINSRPMSTTGAWMAAGGGGPERRVLSIQSHVVHGYVGNKSATFPLQVRENCGFDSVFEYTSLHQYTMIKAKSMVCIRCENKAEYSN